ncbi:type II RES/Xre toxin-antitoxin system antitoxin [Kushneria aurantia]|uniref:Antitoxin Xre/MbcA/ParS toxin-binding domain-containing protein n=1 Tax=Kushneria aurantia TaxID=504092 RepID=A0ABV6G996_9GAMM|nr:antitoxin Xre/MbcA/ParS toxin-binding domain-containing protein [Kushneria aurantia]
MAIAELEPKAGRSIQERTLQRLTGKRPATVKSALDIHALIEKGLPSEGVIDFVETIELLHDKKVVARVFGISERTLYRRRSKPGPLSTEQSGRTWRFAEILTRAEDVFGDSGTAQRWMNTPAMALEGHKPIDLITTQVGHDLVDDLLTRLDYGVYT